MLQGNLRIRRRGDGREQHYHGVPGTISLCPSGVHEDMIHLYGEIRENIHLFLPGLPLSHTAVRELGVDPDRISLRYDGGFRDRLIEQMAWSIRAEMLDPTPAGKMLVETLAAALGVHVLQHHSNLESSSAKLPVARGALDSRRLQRARDLIEANPGNGLTVEMLAHEVSLSPFHFARAFKAATGLPPHAYLTGRRIERAKFWISEGELPLAEIGYRCGFSSQAAFTRWFKRHVGATPRAYREGRR